MAKKAGSKAPQAQPHRGRPRKEGIVAELHDKVTKAQGMVFTNYQGLTHQQIEALKKALRKIDGEYIVAKNTLLLRSLEKVELTDEEKKNFTQATAALFAYGDLIEPLKVLAKSIKDFKLPIIKFGILEGKTITASQVEKLATLPPLPVLRAQLLGQMQSPIQGLHRALSWNMTQLVMTLNAIKEKKPATS